MTRTLPAFALATLAAAACVPQPAPPAPRPAPRPQAAPPPPVAAPTPPPVDWLQADIGEGRWSYRAGGTGTAATWGPAGATRFAMTCDRASRTVRFTRAGAGAGQMELRSTNGVKTLPTVADAGGATATLAAGDPFLNLLVFTRGRFLVTATGADALIAPGWAEPFRVVEDCRA